VNTLFFLVAFPLIVAAIMLVLPKGMLRNPIVIISATLIAAASLYLLATNYSTEPTLYPAQYETANEAMTAIELLIAFYILFASIKAKNTKQHSS